MLDGSIIKVHQDAMRSCYDKAAEAIGSSVGGLSTKIHAKVDSFGRMIVIFIKRGTLLNAFFKKLSVLEELLQDMIKQPECTSPA